jgi:7-cyano-7-deazaguanine reductase
MGENPLGHDSEYPSDYQPGVLFAVSRYDARQELGIESTLPFDGVDIWNAWELSWLDHLGKPMVATAELRIDAKSPGIVESKSLKLYLNSLAMTRYEHADDVMQTIIRDVSAIVGSTVGVTLRHSADWKSQSVAEMPGKCIDDLDVGCAAGDVDPTLLGTTSGKSELEELHSHLFRSNCPVTNQPDMGSVLVRYAGEAIDPSSLLKYLVSYRTHNGFHESCAERIFLDVTSVCKPEKLTVYALFNRRGGIDINPFRSNFEANPPTSRIWRQ